MGIHYDLADHPVPHPLAGLRASLSARASSFGARHGPCLQPYSDLRVGLRPHTGSVAVGAADARLLARGRGFELDLPPDR